MREPIPTIDPYPALFGASPLAHEVMRVLGIRGGAAATLASSALRALCPWVYSRWILSIEARVKMFDAVWMPVVFVVIVLVVAFMYWRKQYN